MPSDSLTGNRGEWSELYAFIKLLKEGRIYAADENVNRINDIYLPIIKIFREENEGEVYDYLTGKTIKIYKDGVFIKELPLSELETQAEFLFSKIFIGGSGGRSCGAFAIDEIKPFMEKMHLKKICTPSIKKTDMRMQIHDINTGYKPEVGFSIKSDVGSPPTLLNPGKNTRIKYKVTGLSTDEMEFINSIDKSVTRNYMVLRISELFRLAENVEFLGIKDSTFNNNLIMIDSLLPQIYGEMVLDHYRNIQLSIYDCEDLVQRLCKFNPMEYERSDIYRYKFKKLISASALGMTPGKVWDGLDEATGGYIIIKRDGDVLCYHLYNRNYFEEYLLNNTKFDRPSASRYDYGHLYKENGELFIDLNIQIRFKSIT